MKTILDILLLTVITTYIVDVSGFTQSWRSAFAAFLHSTPDRLRPLKPFDCGTCMTWWVSLAYLFITHQLTLQGVAICAAASLVSFPLSQLMIFIREGLLKIIALCSRHL